MKPIDNRIFLKPALLYRKTSGKYLFNDRTSRHALFSYGHILTTRSSVHALNVMNTA